MSWVRAVVRVELKETAVEHVVLRKAAVVHVACRGGGGNSSSYG